MSPAAVTQPVLVYTRIANNRRKTWLLVAIAVASIVPFVAAGSYGITRMAFSFFVNRSHISRMSTAQEERILERIDEYPEEIRGEIRANFEKRMREDRRVRDQQEAEDNSLHTRVIVASSVALLAILGLLFWAMASSPTARLLTMCGARPAGMDGVEAGARRLLENLSIGAGLPPPKLYVIDTLALNAFAAGADPQRSVVAVTSGLLSLLDKRELEAVLAHELSHVGNRDTRLNTFVAAIALFLRLPYLLRKQGRRERVRGGESPYAMSHRFQLYRWMMSPVYLYIFVIAPLLAAGIRAAISRSREFLADADAALLTRNPEGLVRALAKIHGAGSIVEGANPAVSHLYFADPTALATGLSVLTGNLTATHPPIDQRINRLLSYSGGLPASVVENAVRAGQAFTKDHPVIVGHNPLDNVTRDELAVVTMGNPMGRVFQVVGATEPVPLYDRADLRSPVITRVANGDLLVVFDDPGKLRQVVTHNETFGYLPMSVKLRRVDVMPAEIHDPVARAVVLAKLAAQPAAVNRPVVAETVGALGLTPQQLKITVGLAAGVFLCGLIVLTVFSK